MSNLSPKTKAAIVVVAVGRKYASEIYKHLGEDEIRRLTLEVARLGDVTDETLQETLREFYSLCLSKKMFAEGGLDYARQMLEDAFGHKIADGYLRQIEEMMDSNSLNIIRNLDERALMNVIQDENPQTVAFILSNAKPEQVSAVVSKLPNEKRVDVVSRIARIDRISKNVLREMERLIAQKLKSVMQGGNSSALDGVGYVADVINSVDVRVEKSILEGIAQKDPGLSEEIIKRMFVFEDILALDSAAVQKVLRDVDRRDLALAVKGASDEIVEYIFSNISQRIVEEIREEISYMTKVRLSDVEGAQQKIVQVIRNLEKSGEIVVEKSGEGRDLVV
ncbi:MAG: flagellar motor switch protein FliG [Oscillospiraceae bacterium]|jgi:flagellar motor switch protein FliG|nr:flagellar motor switch protein FliG [Oscillospiraceae bacterium]